MSVARRKGDPGKADFLFSRIVRSRGMCERCGYDGGPFDTAHIVRRRYSATRCVEDNAWCLCRTCHHDVDEWQLHFMSRVAVTIGEERYVELCLMAQEGIPMSSAVFWRDTVARLTERCNELGISTKWRAA